MLCFLKSNKLGATGRRLKRIINLTMKRLLIKAGIIIIALWCCMNEDSADKRNVHYPKLTHKEVVTLDEVRVLQDLQCFSVVISIFMFQLVIVINL